MLITTLLANASNMAPEYYGPSSALGQLKIPITPNTGVFTLTFRTSRIVPLMGGSAGTAPMIYAVRLAPGAALPAAPTSNNYSNVSLYGPGRVRLLGSVLVPATYRPWQSHTITFNSNDLVTADDGQPMGSMTHILIASGNYNYAGRSFGTIGFDAICLRNLNV